jgi:hypothetical protein
MLGDHRSYGKRLSFMSSSVNLHQLTNMTTQGLDLPVPNRSFSQEHQTTDGSDPMAQTNHKLTARNDASTAKKLISELHWGSLWSEITSRQLLGMAT